MDDDDDDVDVVVVDEDDKDASPTTPSFITVVTYSISVFN